MKFTPLSAPIDTQRDAVEGQGTSDIELKSRRLRVGKATDPNKVSVTKNNIYLYSKFVTPEDEQYSRVIAQLQISTPSINISSQLNNRINPTMQNHTVKGGTRKSI